MIWNFSFSKNIFYRGLDIRVTKVVEAYAPQAVPVKQLRKRRRDVVRFYQHSHLIYADVAEKVTAVAAAAQFPLLILLVLKIEQPLFEKRHERHRPHAGLVLRPVSSHHHLFAVDAARRHGVANCDGVVFKVYGLPPETHRFAAAQAIERTEQDRQLQLSSFCRGKKLVQLVAVVKAPDKSGFLWQLDVIRGIVRNQLQLHRHVQCLVYVGVVVYDGIRGDSLYFLVIKRLYITRLQG